jgi:hypothetical protein
VCEDEEFDLIVNDHGNELMHTGCNQSWAEFDCKYYGITKAEVAISFEHRTISALTRGGESVDPAEPIFLKELWRNLLIDSICFQHLGQIFNCFLHVSNHFSRFPAAYLMETEDCESMALHLGGFIGHLQIPGILQFVKGTQLKGVCNHLVKLNGITDVHWKPLTTE